MCIFKLFANTHQIIILPTKGKALSDINWLGGLDICFHACSINCGQPALRKWAYGQPGQTLTSMDEWEACEAYL